MNILESKVIQTKLEKEIFIDQSSNIELKGFQYPQKDFPFYQVLVGLELIRLRENDFYGTKQAYFGIKITEDLQSSLIIFEPEQQSIFAVKNEQEKQAVTELIDYLLIESPVFKQLVTTMIDNLKNANVISEREIRDIKAKLDLLDRLLTIDYEDLKFAIQKKDIA